MPPHSSVYLHPLPRDYLATPSKSVLSLLLSSKSLIEYNWFSLVAIEKETYLLISFDIVDSLFILIINLILLLNKHDLKQHQLQIYQLHT